MFQKINFDYGTEKYYLLNHLTSIRVPEHSNCHRSFLCIENYICWDFGDCFMPAVQVTMFHRRVSKFWPPTSELFVNLPKYFWTHDSFHLWQRILIVHINSIFQCPSQITIA